MGYGRFITGSSADGSDGIAASGMYINPKNPNEWSNMPYTAEEKEHERQVRIFRSIISYLRKKYKTNEGFDVLLEKEYQLMGQRCMSNLNPTQREFLRNYFAEEEKVEE